MRLFRLPEVKFGPQKRACAVTFVYVAALKQSIFSIKRESQNMKLHHTIMVIVTKPPTKISYLFFKKNNAVK